MPLPFEFEDLLAASLPADEAAPLLDSLNWPSHTCVRINPAKKTQLRQELILSGIPFCEQAFLLKERPEFVADPLFHAGYYYVQEASSTIIGTVVQELLKEYPNPALVLDLCAAPGGKSTHLAATLRENDLLVSNEVIQSRTPILHENLCKWGFANHIITRADAAHFASSGVQFDIILADMPCSGEGLFRKDPDSVSQWSPENVELCTARQNRIAHDIWPALKPGGTLIYSTCTYNKKENEDNVKQLAVALDAEIKTFPFPETWNIFSNEPGMYRMLPHRTPGEGFFFSVLQKKGRPDTIKPDARKAKNTLFQHYHLSDFDGDGISFFRRNEEVYAIRTEDSASLFALLQKLPMLYAPGTPVGKVLEKRKETIFKPETSLALLTSDFRLNYPEITLNDAEVIRFLRRDSIGNSQQKKGTYVATWQNMKMGFLQGVNHQWNHIWPMEWRLRKEGLQPFTILDI